VEYEAVKRHLKNLAERIHEHGTVYETGTFSGTDGSTWEVSIAEIGAGNAGAAAEVERALAFFRPEVVMFVGVAGDLKDVSVGDVVVATKVYGYESGRAADEFHARPAVFNSAYDLEQRARAEAKREDWIKRIGDSGSPQFKVFIAPIAAGEKVVASRQSAFFGFIRANYGDALAVEMEGFGFLEAAHLNQSVRAVVVRGISDLIDHKEQVDAGGSQQRAARSASAFAFEVLAKFCSETSAQSRTGYKSAKEYDPPLDVGAFASDTMTQPTSSPRSRSASSLRFLPNDEVEALIKGVKLGDWAASADAAIQIIAKTAADGANSTFDALLRYYECPNEELKWAALQTIERAAALAPLLIDRATLTHLANHGDFSVRASVASICMDLAHFAPSLVPIDILLRLSTYDEDWYVQAPANAALKTLVRSMPDVLRIFLARLRSDEPSEREHAASALVDIAKHEPDLIDFEQLREEVRRLENIGDAKALMQLKKVLRAGRTAPFKGRFKYGL